MNDSASDALAREARILARYLLGRDCPREMEERYARAHAVRFGAAAKPDAASRFAFAHPWSLGFLDAAGAITARAPVLRGKLHLMCAILEASPRFATEFLPRHVPTIATIARLGASGLVVFCKAIVGVPLLFAIGDDAP